MISYANGRKVAVLEGDQAVAKTEQVLRLLELHVNFLQGEANCVFYRGFIREDGNFQVTHPQPVMVSLKDTPPQSRMPMRMPDGKVEIVDIPAKTLFTQLTVPKLGDAKWIGDVTQLDIEALIIDNDLLPDIEISDIVPQTKKNK